MKGLVPLAIAVTWLVLAWVAGTAGAPLHRPRRAATRPTHPELSVASSPCPQPARRTLTVVAGETLPVDDLALLTHVGKYSDSGARVRVFRRLLAGDDTLARSVQREAARADQSDFRRLQLISLLAFTREPSVRAWLRSAALGSDDLVSVLALAAILDADTPPSDSSDDRIASWGSLGLAELEKTLVDSSRNCGWGRLHGWDIPPRGTRLATPWGIARSPAAAEIVRRVAAHGMSVEARVLAIRSLPDDWDSLGLLLSIGVDPASPVRVKTAAFECLPIGSVDFDRIAEAIRHEKDPDLLFVLCKHVATSGQSRAPETCALLEGIAPLAQEDRDLSLILTVATNHFDHPEALESLERLARTAASGDVRGDALCALTQENRQGFLTARRVDALRRLAFDEDRALACAASRAIVYAALQARKDPSGQTAFLLPHMEDWLLPRARDLLENPISDIAPQTRLARALMEWRSASTGAAFGATPRTR